MKLYRDSNSNISLEELEDLNKSDEKNIAVILINKSIEAEA